MKILEKSTKFSGVAGPLVCIVMDGIGIAPEGGEGNAVSRAYTPTLDYLLKNCPVRSLKAHGTAVGLPSDDDMGNSEVGHNAIGAGQVFAQGAKLVTSSIESGAMFASKTWGELRDNCLSNKSALHFIGLFSDGNVHSHIDHLQAMIKQAKADGVGKVRVHVLLDGRDVGETSALLYIEPFESFLAGINGPDFDARIAGGGGRQHITMDRYGADWGMVERGWRTHVLGEGRQFASAAQAVETMRAEAGGRVIDQDLGAFIIAQDGRPVGTVEDGDSVIFYNFRGDRAIEISMAFEGGPDFNKFERVRVPRVIYAGMLEYDGDLHIPSKYLVSPPEITGTLGEYLARSQVTQLAVSETQKFGHVTYFWNGNRSGKFDGLTETYVEIKSDVLPFEQRPWMKAAEITDTLIDAVKSGKHKFIRANYPNGDMVGHTGNLAATIIAVETVDLTLARVIEAVREANGVIIVTADHGNSDEMYELDKKGAVARGEDGLPKSKTAHTLNPVPCIFIDRAHGGAYKIKEGGFGLSNLAATFANLLGYEAPDFWDESMIEFK